jgi:hypothetical protein
MDLKRVITLAFFGLPLAFVALAGVLLALNSPWDWSERTSGSYRVPSWAVSLSTLMLAIPAWVLAGWGFLDILKTTRGKYHFLWFQLLCAGLATCLGALILYGVSQSDLHRTFSYDVIYGVEFDSRKGTTYGTTAFGSLFTTLVLMGLAGGVFCGAAFLYCKGIVSDGSGRYDKRADEVDATAVLMREIEEEKALQR